jgi:hypothetical protein
MTAADRSIRQQAADHAGREARIEAVTRDLHAVAEYYGETTNHEIGSHDA